MRARLLVLAALFSRVAIAAEEEVAPTPAVTAVETATPEATATPVAGPEATASSESTPAPETPALPSDAPRLFLDCQYCDSQYMRENVAFVVYVRDRADADVHVLVSSRPTGAGGSEYTLRFIGLGRFAEMLDEQIVFAKPQVTDDERREQLARALRLGLARYAARTRVARELDVSWTPAEEAPAPENDPWNKWVMSLNLSGFFIGESSYSNSNTNGSVGASRVTELWKIRSSAYVDINESRYDLGSGLILKTFRRDVGTNVLVGRGFGDHFALGVRPTWSSSTYNNIRTQFAATGVAEWSVFPYSESTKRALVLQWGPRVEQPVYYEETIFEKHSEILFLQTAQARLDLTQPWGSVTLGVYGSHYLHDVSKANVLSNVSLDLRLVRGLSLNLYGSLSLVRDQISLPKSGATPEEILLRRQQLATQYNYYSSVGLTYTFGSIFTPVVNTRLD